MWTSAVKTQPLLLLEFSSIRCARDDSALTRFVCRIVAENTPPRYIWVVFLYMKTSLIRRARISRFRNLARMNFLPRAEGTDELCEISHLPILLSLNELRFDSRQFIKDPSHQCLAFRRFSQRFERLNIVQECLVKIVDLGRVCTGNNWKPNDGFDVSIDDLTGLAIVCFKNARNPLM